MQERNAISLLWRTGSSLRRAAVALVALALALPMVLGPTLTALALTTLLAPSTAEARGFKSSSFRSSSSRSWSSSRSSYRSSIPRSSPSRSSYSPRPSSSSSTRSATDRPRSSSRSVPMGRMRGGPLTPLTGFGYSAGGVGYRSSSVASAGSAGSGASAGVAVVIIIAFVGAAIVFGAVIFIVVMVRRNEKQRRLGGAKAAGVLGAPPPGPPPGPRELDPELANHWLGLRPGDQVAISDVVAFKDALDIGRGSVHGSDYAVSRVTWAEDDGGRRFALALLDNPSQPLLLLVSVHGEAASLRLLHRPDGAPSGNRADLLDAGAFWLFQAPANPDRFRPVDLDWALDIEQEGMGESGKEEVHFSRQEVRKLRAGSVPRSPDGEQFPLTMAEFHTDSAAADPWLIAIESGGAGRDFGGHVEVWQGCDLSASDVSVTPDVGQVAAAA